MHATLPSLSPELALDQGTRPSTFRVLCHVGHHCGVFRLVQVVERQESEEWCRVSLLAAARDPNCSRLALSAQVRSASGLLSSSLLSSTVSILIVLVLCVGASLEEELGASVTLHASI